MSHQSDCTQRNWADDYNDDEDDDDDGDLDFEVQQVAVDLVVNIGVILLLAQVQPWDVHRGLQADKDR